MFHVSLNSFLSLCSSVFCCDLSDFLKRDSMSVTKVISTNSGINERIFNKSIINVMVVVVVLKTIGHKKWVNSFFHYLHIEVFHHGSYQNAPSRKSLCSWHLHHSSLHLMSTLSLTHHI